jgi:hypothetical protein
MHHLDEQSMELDFIIEFQKTMPGCDVGSSCTAGLGVEI